MYLNHFDLCKKPFENTTNPRFFWFNDSFTEALAALEYALGERKGIILLTGDSGSGKTSLIRTFIETVDPAVPRAVIPDPDMAPIDFFNYLASELDIHQSFSSKGDFLASFKRYLKETLSNGIDKGKVLIVIDEAQRASNRLLNDLRLLNEMGTDDETEVIVILTGRTQLLDKLSEPTNASLKSRLALNIRINMLNQYDTHKYITHRLREAGAQRDIFTPNAMASVYQFTRGNPLQINNLCDRSMLTGYANESSIINSEIVIECAAELGVSLDSNLAGGGANEDPAVEDQPEISSEFKSSALGHLKLMVFAIIGAAFIILLQLSIITQKNAEQRALEEQASTTFEVYQQQLEASDGDLLTTF